MRAVVKAEKGVEIKDVPYPVAGRDEVIIQVYYAGICGSDISRYRDNIYMPPGIILGHEYAGVIVEKGSEVEAFQVGDRVTSSVAKTCQHCYQCRRGEVTLCSSVQRIGIDFNGAFAQYVAVPAYLVHHLPPEMTFQQGASVEPVAVVTRAIEKVGISAGDTVLVYGPGPIGLYALQVVLASGAVKAVVAGTRDSRLELARRLGAHHTINIKQENLREKVAKYTDGLMADVVVEAAGSPDVVEDVFATVRRGGGVVFTGLPYKPSRFDLQAMVRREPRVHASILNSWIDFHRAIKLLAAGKVRTDGIITAEYPLEEFEKAAQAMINREAVKVLLKIAPGS